MKKVLALMMALLMTVSLLPVSAFAAGIGDGDNGVTPETLPAEDTAQDSEPDIVGNEDQDAEKDGTSDDGNALDGAEKNGNAVENVGEGDTSAAIIGITGPKTDVKDTCTLTIEDNEYFDVTGAGEYDYGENVTITATPKHAGVVFEEWYEDREIGGVEFSDDAAYSFIIDRDITLEILDDPACTAFIRQGEDVENQFVTNSRKANTTDRGVMYFTADDEGVLQFLFPASDYFEAPEGTKFDCWELNGKSYEPGETLTLIESGDDHTASFDTITVIAKWAQLYDVWVNGEQFSAGKLTINCGDGTATYDPDTATLTLDGAEITKAHEKSAGIGGAIYAEQALTVNVIGESTISLGEYATGKGIYTTGNLTIMGDKALNITTKNQYASAVWVNGGDLTVNMNGNLTVTAAGTALSATGNVSLSGSGSKTISAGADANGIYSSGADITLSGSGNVTIDAGNGIYAQTGNTELAGNGDIVIDAKKDGFKVIGNLTVGGSGKLTVDAGTYGILCNDMIFTDERTADITAGEDGIVPAGEIELGGSGDITITAEVYGINVYYNGDVYISGSGKLTVTAGYIGIVSYNGAILSGSGEVEIYGKENAVYFDNVQGAVRLDGTCSSITLRADQGKKAVYNITTNQSPVAGTAFDDYRCVTGAPNTASVVYRLEHSYGEATYTWDNNQCTAAHTCTVCPENVTGHTETETVTGTYVKDTDASCTTAEGGHYEVSFENEDFTAQQTAAESVTEGNPLGHSFPDTWEQHNAEQHKHTCIRCGIEVEYVDHDFSGNTCKDCGYVKGNTYTIIAGGNGKWTKSSVTGLAFTSDAPFDKFDSVQVDGNTVAASNYTAVEGSTKITLAPAYLETLSVGSHSIKIVSNDGSASTNFSVNAAAQPPADSSNPKTGDNSHMTLWVILLAASGAALTGTAIYSKKKKYRAK